MKKLFIIFLSTVFLSQIINAQVGRYQEEIFEEVQVTYDISYATNMDIMPMLLGVETAPVSVDLKLDIYEPVGDTVEMERALVLVFHDGDFLPQVLNKKLLGTKTDSSCVEICTQLAKRGYVAASVDYRLGWNPTVSTSQDLSQGFVQAIYRATQDAKTAIRFFRKNHAEDGNLFRIDPNRIIVWGHGSGGIISLNMVALSHLNEIVTTTHHPTKLIYDIDSDGFPDIPMILDFLHGDIEGKVTTIVEEDLFLFSEGDTSNLGNYPNYSSDFNLAVNVSGGIIDISWLSDNTTPTLSYQSPFDQFYPYDDAVYVVQPGMNPVLQIQGAQLIGASQNDLENDQLWIDEEVVIHQFSMSSTNQAIANSATLQHPYYQSVFPFINAPNSNGHYEGVVIDWWNPEALSPDGVPWNELPHPYGGTYHENALIYNENMSAEKARLTIDTIIEYFIPRACIALNLECPVYIDTFTIVDEVIGNIPVSLYPNPTSNLLNVDAKDKSIKSIQIYDSKGTLVKTYSSIDSSQKELKLNDLPKGLFLFKIEFKDDAIAVVRKISLQ